MCDDKNSCTIDECNVYDDGIPICVNTPIVCNQTDPCNPQTCNKISGKCEAIPLSCNDFNLCTIDTCIIGSYH